MKIYSMRASDYDTCDGCGMQNYLCACHGNISKRKGLTTVSPFAIITTSK